MKHQLKAFANDEADDDERQLASTKFQSLVEMEQKYRATCTNVMKTKKIDGPNESQDNINRLQDLAKAKKVLDVSRLPQPGTSKTVPQLTSSKRKRSSSLPAHADHGCPRPKSRPTLE